MRNVTIHSMYTLAYIKTDIKTFCTKYAVFYRMIVYYWRGIKQV